MIDARLVLVVGDIICYFRFVFCLVSIRKKLRGFLTWCAVHFLLSLGSGRSGLVLVCSLLAYAVVFSLGVRGMLVAPCLK